MNVFNLIALASLQPLAAVAFSFLSDHSPCRHDTRVCAAALSTDDGAAVQEVKTKTPVSRISVCAEELCQCQGEQYEYTGGASDDAIEELQSLGLPFPVDRVGCLGACGMGTMIAIDYENGNSVIMDGLESALTELGVQRQSPSTADTTEIEKDTDEVDSGPVAIPVTKAVEVALDINDGDEDLCSSPIASIPLELPITVNNNKKEEGRRDEKKPPLLADPRERMRQEAADIEVENPWINMASYLAKKAFGSE